MRAVRSGEHLEQIGETWYYRRVIPSDVRDAFGGGYQRRFSLKTKSLTEAKRLEKEHDVEFESKLKAARETGPDGHSRHPGRRTGEFISHIFEDDDRSPGWLDRALKKVPEADRDDVRLGVELIDKEVDADQVAIDDFWHRELRDLLVDIYYDDDPEVWRRTRNDLVEQLKNYRQHEADPTIDWAYEKWLEARNRPQQTQDEARRYIDDFKKSAKARALTAVRRRHVTDWRSTLQAAGSLAPKSINHRLEIVGAILRHGWREAEITDAPDLKRINVPESDDGERTSWTPEEILAKLGALEPGSWAAWIFVILLTTGTRLGEPVAARKEWFDPLGFINVPARFTKQKKPHTMPIIGLLREPLVRHLRGVGEGDFMFAAPRPSNPKLKISHEASKWFSRHKHEIPKVIHELRDTWIEGARYSKIKKEIYEIISGHSGKTVSDRYGGERPDELLKANERICAKFLTPEMMAVIRRLIR